MKAINKKFKTCTQCENTLSTDNFYPQQQKGKNGQIWKYFDSMCKSCRGDYASKRRRNIKDKAVEYLGGVCEDCGVKDHSCIYDFHHEDPDKKDFAVGKQAKAFKNIKDELDKCILLCANCHRKRHYQ